MAPVIPPEPIIPGVPFAFVSLGFCALLGSLWVAAIFFGAAREITAPTVLSCAILLAPFWAFGFGADQWLRQHRSVFTPLLPVFAYPVFALPRGDFRWDMCLGMAAVVLAVSLLLNGAPENPGWRDWTVLAILGISVDLHFFDKAWPLPGLSSLPKLLFVDAGLYGYLVLRPIGGIGYDFRLRLTDFRNGLREFLFYTPAALGIGFALGFLHFHRILAGPLWFASGWLFTFFFIAVPEELFFRGLLLNLLERKIGTGRALAVSSVLFGLAHFNKRAVWFNWRYVILAAFAGCYYARAWLSERRIAASSITHATVDTVWSIWLR